jgi:homoserine kinase
VTVRVPASSANLGPGFDALAIALSMYIEVDLELADELQIETFGHGAGTFDDERHLGVRVARQVLGHDRFKMSVRSDIPVARGLGSSAALALAAAAAAGAADPLAIAVDVDGHAENAAASWCGGLVVATVIDSSPVVESLVLDPAFRFVVVIPDVELETIAAREVLPASVAFRDATFNLARLGLLIAGLADHSRLRAASMDDRMHQRYRAQLLPFADDLLGRLRDGGAISSCWSGAGSTMLGVTTVETADEVAAAARGALAELSVPGEVRVLTADSAGLVRT